MRDRCRDRVHFGLCFVERETGGDARAGAQKSPVARLAFAVARRRGGVVGSLDDTSRRWIRRYGGSTERPSDGPLFSRARDRSNRRPEKLVAQNRDPSLGRDFLGCERGNAVLEPIRISSAEMCVSRTRRGRSSASCHRAFAHRGRFAARCNSSSHGTWRASTARSRTKGGTRDSPATGNVLDWNRYLPGFRKPRRGDRARDKEAAAEQRRR